MMTLVGGLIALVLGIFGLAYWWGPFIVIIQAFIPIGLILGGALAMYLGYEEWKDAEEMAKSESVGSDAEVERYKAEAQRYKEELEALKKEKEDGDAA